MPSISSLFTVAALACSSVVAVVPAQMQAMQASGTPCSPPDWSCLSTQTVVVPRPKVGEMLVQMKGSSVNPISLVFVEPACKSFGACSNGTIGIDGSGVVVELGLDANNTIGNDCAHYKPGDEVWFAGVGGFYAEYATVNCGSAGPMPKSLSFLDAGTLGTVGQTSLLCLQAAGTITGKTVVVTSGQGGTGFIAIQLAKALGASRVITAATGAGINATKKLGADTVIDYHKQELFDALPADSVDVVFDNYPRPGTADKAMHAIRRGGVFMSNGGQISNHPKDGVRQVPACRTKPFGTEVLNPLAKLFDAGELQPLTMSSTYGLAQVPEAFTRYAAHGVIGKIAVVISATGVPTEVAAKPPCHRITGDELSCVQSEDKDSCAADYAQFVYDACSSVSFRYCFHAMGGDLWASAGEKSCAEGLKVLHNLGFKNDGCGGKSDPLPCGSTEVVV